MSEKKHIDRLFQEKFKDFHTEPNPAVWDKINASLAEGKKKKRSVIPLWFQLGGIAAGILLFVAIGNLLFNTNNNTLPIVNTQPVDASNTDVDNITNTPNAQNISITDSNTSISNASEDNSTVSKQKNTSNTLATNQSKNKLNSNTSQAKGLNTSSQRLAKNNNNIIGDANVNAYGNKTLQTNINSEAKKETITNDSRLTTTETIDNLDTPNKAAEELLTPEATKDATSIVNAIAEQDKTITEEEEESINRWSIASNVSPVYFGSLGEGSSINNQLDNNPKSSTISMSYGIAAKYNISKRFKVRAGVNRVDLNQTTSDVIVFSDQGLTSRNASAQQNNITLNSDISSISIVSNRTLTDNSTIPEVFNSKIPGDLDQRFSFIEVPLELEYSLIDKKFGFNVIGGFSTLILNNNDIYADIDGVSTLIGEANNINSTSFTANFGLGLNYKLAKNWQINLEPQFKYQINTFNNISGNFRPFFVGVYTGLNFKF